MNSLARQFFSIAKEDKDVHFCEIHILNEQTEWNWSDIYEKAPSLPRPWFELSRLSPSDRIEFIQDLWLNRLSYNPKGYLALANFFQRLDDIGIVLHKQSPEQSFSVEMVYSLADNSSFFRGLPPCTEKDMDHLKISIPYDLPQDFQAFLQIHHGFGKLSELGLLQVDAMIEERQNTINLLSEANYSIYSEGHVVDPNAFIPFYESFGLVSYQCFYADWYPGSEMGNIYLSGIDYTISDISDRKTWTEQLAFPTFLEWLVYYLEGMGENL